MTLATQYPQYVTPLIELTFNQVVGEHALHNTAIPPDSP